MVFPPYMAHKKKVSEVRDSDVSCYYCNKPIAENALKCPHCGKVFSVGKKIAAFVIVIILLTSGVGYLMNDYFNGPTQGEGDDDNPEYFTSSAKYTVLWILIDDEWKMSRIYSFDHQAPK